MVHIESSGSVSPKSAGDRLPMDEVRALLNRVADKYAAKAQRKYEKPTDTGEIIVDTAVCLALREVAGALLAFRNIP